MANENLLRLPSYLKNDDMHLHLEECMSDNLSEAYLCANCVKEMDNIKDFDKWIKEVHVLDEVL